MAAERPACCLRHQDRICARPQPITFTIQLVWTVELYHTNYWCRGPGEPMPTTVATHNSTLASRGGFRSERPRYAAGCGLARPILSPSGNCGRWANLECVARRRGRARDPRLKSKSLIGPAEKETAVEGGPAADHRRLARRPVLNDPIQLIGPASLVGNSRETFHKSGTDGSNPVPSSDESHEPEQSGNLLIWRVQILAVGRPTARDRWPARQTTRARAQSP